ncbi:MAG TPA: hypothetical protein VHJ20_22335 [Polyangia bacterium]|nr:hypothetical protein [Polyangia bacterium]
MRLDDAGFEAGVRSLRAATAAPSDGAATRARVLGLLERGRVRRAMWRRAAAAAAIALMTAGAGSVAWTAIGHWRARVTSAPNRQSSVPSRLTPTVAAAAPIDPSPPPLAPSPPAPRPDVEGDARAYARAHELHFHDDDPARALSAWNRYLTSYPHGAFVPDARYNRALCLLRLGRTTAAAEALRPFAAGAFHGYRRLEAESLLDWIARQTTP